MSIPRRIERSLAEQDRAHPQGTCSDCGRTIDTTREIRRGRCDGCATAEELSGTDADWNPAAALARLRWADVPADERASTMGELSRQRWADLTDKERSAEMRRRRRKGLRKHR